MIASPHEVALREKAVNRRITALVDALLPLPQFIQSPLSPRAIIHRSTDYIPSHVGVGKDAFPNGGCCSQREEVGSLDEELVVEETCLAQVLGLVVGFRV